MVQSIEKRTSPGDQASQNRSQDAVSFWNGRKISFGVKCFIGALGVALIVTSVVFPPFAGVAAVFLASKLGLGAIGASAITVLHTTLLGIGCAMTALTLLPITDLIGAIYYRGLGYWNAHNFNEPTSTRQPTSLEQNMKNVFETISNVFSNKAKQARENLFTELSQNNPNKMQKRLNLMSSVPVTLICCYRNKRRLENSKTSANNCTSYRRNPPGRLPPTL